jgi:hypothetical protein
LSSSRRIIGVSVIFLVGSTGIGFSLEIRLPRCPERPPLQEQQDYEHGACFMTFIVYSLSCK